MRMRRLVTTTVAATCVALAAPAALTPSALGAKVPKLADARAKLVACKSALDQASRSLTVDASMRSLAENDRMQMRFELFSREPGKRRFHRLPGPGLGSWNPATPGVDRFRFRKPIQNLPAPATYYVKVAFRWLDADGTPYARTARFTANCYQPDRRPDLRIAAFARPVRVGTGDFVYRVTLRNAGRTASRDFDAVLTVGGLPRPAVNVAPLAPREIRVVELHGPRCDPGATARVELDPDNRVDEASETNNSRSITC
jgi:hypothetical protein